MGTSVSPAEATDYASFAKAWARHDSEVRAIKLETDRHPNVDILYVAAQVERIARKLGRYRERLVLETPLFPIAWLDELSSLALAAMWAGVQLRGLAKPAATAGPLIAAALDHRRRLAAALRGEIAYAEVPTTRRVPTLAGRRPAHYAAVIEGLVIALRELGFDRTAARANDLAAAEHLVVQLMQASGPRREPSPALVEARELRAKVLLLLQRRYEGVRAAILFVGRDEPGIQRLVPKLFALRLQGTAKGGRRRKRVGAGAAGPVELAPVVRQSGEEGVG